MGLATQQLVRSGAQSAVFELTPPDPSAPGDMAVLTKDDWASLPSGALRDLLNRTYFKPGGTVDSEGFISAQAAAGLVVSGGLDPVLEIQLTLSTSLADEGYPRLFAIWPVAGANNYVKLAVSYSASE